MNLIGARVLLTGAGSGIGRECALELAGRGARLAVVGRNLARLDRVCAEIRRTGGWAAPLAFDLAEAGGHAQLVGHAADALGGIDVLLNNAGTGSFGAFADEDPAHLRELVLTNLAGPMLLARAVLPLMLRAGRGRIVNVGSTFGSIGFPHFAAYSASKFGLRGFSEALRRELHGSGVGVTYVAPRGTRTGLNSDALYRLAEKVGMAMDEPQAVARAIVRAIERDRAELFLGGMEPVFARLNGLLPRLVDLALRGQTRVARDYAGRKSGAAAEG